MTSFIDLFDYGVVLNVHLESGMTCSGKGRGKALTYCDDWVGCDLIVKWIVFVLRCFVTPQ